MGSLIGPTLIAGITDYVFQDEHALRYAISAVALIALASALILLLTVRPKFRESVEELAATEGL